jgi:HPr kinase/phosphorylase
MASDPPDDSTGPARRGIWGKPVPQSSARAPGVWPVAPEAALPTDVVVARATGTAAPPPLGVRPGDRSDAPLAVWARPATVAKLAADGHGGPVHIHATTVAWQGRAALITGAPGSGKSALGLILMAYGCNLIADDQTIVNRQGDALMAFCPPTIQGRIEARGVGILTATHAPEATLVLAIDMNQTETQRLPLPHSYPLLGLSLPLLHKADTPSFAAAILQYIKQDQSDPGPPTS